MTIADGDGVGDGDADGDGEGAGIAVVISAIRTAGKKSISVLTTREHPQIVYPVDNTAG
jgi:hypothetical protein